MRLQSKVTGLFLAYLTLLWTSLAYGQTCSRASTGQGGSLNGFRPFPAGDPINTDISNPANYPVDPNSASQICTVDGSPPCGSILWPHPDFSAGGSPPAGIPYYIVDDTQPVVNVSLGTYASQSDDPSGSGVMPVPIPVNAAVEGGGCVGDAHAIVVNKSSCWAYELYHVCYSGGRWSADGGFIWDLLNDEQRPLTWTSADAAGLPMFPLLVRYDEASTGTINHAIRATFALSRAAFVLPATHYTTSGAGTGWPPMGMRGRLKAGFDTTGGGTFSTATQSILKAMQKYGFIMADNGGGGSGWMITGVPDSRWDDTTLHNELAGVKLNNFEIITNNSNGAPMTSYGPDGTNSVPTGSAPTISSFTVSLSSIAAGQSTTLSWNAAGGSYSVISPDVGPVRGNSVTVAPRATTIYTLGVTNSFGRTTAKVKVKVTVAP
jgi:hypothetical protein